MTQLVQFEIDFQAHIDTIPCSAQSTKTILSSQIMFFALCFNFAFSIPRHQALFAFLVPAAYYILLQNTS